MNPSKPPYSPNVVNQTVSYGGATWKGNPGSDWTLESGGGGGGGNVDVVGNAQKLLDFQKQANAPVAQALGSNVQGIKDQYSQLVNSIKGNQQLSTNRQTLATSNELGQRGILPTSGLYQQEMSNALTPIDTQYSGLLANAGQGSIQDLQNLAVQIANLQAGNPDTTIGNALSLSGLQNQSQQIANEFNLGQQNVQAQLNPNYIPIPGIGLYNTQNSNLVNQFNGGGGVPGGIQWINGQPYVNQ